ncbi:MAG TPA: NAD(P)/FAD-dependent oxidoreductase [Rhizomicrobium sp.]|nr:NAD(P)/FAD-dependent oxidoreductase [Rhizomicrobium sp.]
MSGHFSAEAVVIGAGVVGLAVARALALVGREVVILEKNAQIGMETSARNSEVIHAGIYYSQGSLKATLCVAGRARLYDFCESHGVGHKRLGKLIVATNAQQEELLPALARHAAANGVDDLKLLGKRDVAALEPELSATAALLSPSTGIIDSHAYMTALLGDAEAAGANLVRNARVTAIARSGNGYRVTVENAGETLALQTRFLINSAGLWAPHLASLIEGLDPRFVPPTFLAKGNYVSLTVKSPFRHLIYPVPEPGGLGVHLTLDMDGAARFGPNVEWLATDDPGRIDYAVASDLPVRFAPLIAAYWPKIRTDMLAPGYSGVRPKAGGPKDPNADFRIEGPETHSHSGLVNLFGIESPGLTASLAIAEKVEGMLRDG